MIDETSEAISELSNSRVRWPGKVISSRSSKDPASTRGKPGSVLALVSGSGISGVAGSGVGVASARRLDARSVGSTGGSSSKVRYSGGMGSSRFSNANISEEVSRPSGGVSAAVGIPSMTDGGRGMASSANVSGASSSVGTTRSDSVASASESVESSNSKDGGSPISSAGGSSRVVMTGSTISARSLPDGSSDARDNTESSTENSTLSRTTPIASSVSAGAEGLAASVWANAVVASRNLMVGRVGSTTSGSGSADAIGVSSASTTSWSGNDTRVPEESATLMASSTLSASASSILLASGVSAGMRCAKSM